MNSLHLEDEFFQFSCKSRIDIAGSPAKQISECKMPTVDDTSVGAKTRR